MNMRQMRATAAGILAAVMLLIAGAGFAVPAHAEETAASASEVASSYASETASGATGSTRGASGNASDTAESVTAAADTSSVAMTNLVDGWPEMRAINEASGYLMDADNGAVLYSLNSDHIRYPASTTKILTALLVIENCDLSDTVTMTSIGTQMVEAGSTNAGTVNGETFTVEQCLYMLLLKSANDIANQLAEFAGGSIDEFVSMMNQRAKDLGCTDTHFTNPSGMPDSEHYTTAEDMALIMNECIKNETFLKISQTQTYTVPATAYSAERTYTNHNGLVVKNSDHYYKYCIAGKTGYTDAAWRTYVGAARKDGRTLIVVLMRGPDNRDFQDAADLFEYGFDNFQTIKVTGGSATIPNTSTEAALTADASEEDDGTCLVRLYYNGLRVGSAEMSSTQYEKYGERLQSLKEEYTEELSAAEEAESQTDSRRTGSALISGNIDLRAILIALAVIIAVTALGGAYARSRSKKHRRRRK